MCPWVLRVKLQGSSIGAARDMYPPSIPLDIPAQDMAVIIGAMMSDASADKPKRSVRLPGLDSQLSKRVLGTDEPWELVVDRLIATERLRALSKGSVAGGQLDL